MQIILMSPQPDFERRDHVFEFAGNTWRLNGPPSVLPRLVNARDHSSISLLPGVAF
jgi:hypothetical protein